MVQDVGSGHPVHLVKLGITLEQAANLRKLADYLLTLPAQYPDFEMASYAKNVDASDLVTVPECGTAACAAGHGPLAGVRPLFGETWDTYSHRAFASKDDAWSWCFSASWAWVDNTAHGAARRILWLLKSGVPDDAMEQAACEAPLCYLAEQASA